ncbi:MAG TPA: hypothetical protein VHD90_23220 [Phototrophicaceae bacterium]|nr:hypothetical protein [Phototrophicaceae bacterium]
MNKLTAIVHYEILMAWRRRSLPILWFLLLAGVLGFALLVRQTNLDSPVMNQAVQASASGANALPWTQGIDLVVAMNTLALINVLIAGMVFYMVGVTLLLGEVIPLDSQFKVRELLDTLPISRTLYLGGKLASVWTSLLLGIGVIGVISALALRLIFGAYDLRVFLILWIALLVPQTLIAALLSVLCASFVGSRRSAVLVGLLVIPFVLTLAFTTVVSFAGAGALIEPIYALGLLLKPGAETNAEIVNRMTSTLIGFVLIGAAVWTFVWGWSRLREAS